VGTVRLYKTGKLSSLPPTVGGRDRWKETPLRQPPVIHVGSLPYETLPDPSIRLTQRRQAMLRQHVPFTTQFALAHLSNTPAMRSRLNLESVMHQQFSIKQLYVLPTLYLCVLYLSENKQRLAPLTA
jgi:hypothetical protein